MPNCAQIEAMIGILSSIVPGARRLLFSKNVFFSSLRLRLAIIGRMQTLPNRLCDTAHFFWGRSRDARASTDEAISWRCFPLINICTHAQAHTDTLRSSINQPSINHVVKNYRWTMLTGSFFLGLIENRLFIYN